MRILITGAGGLLGSDLTNVLSREHEITAVTHRPATHLNVASRQADFSISGSAAAIINEIKPELLFHCAAMTQVDACETSREQALKLNVGVTQEIIQTCNQTGTFPVFFSTDYVFDGKKMGEYDESDTQAPLNIYGETKFLAEKEIIKNAVHFAVFRISWLYGLNGTCFPKTILEKSKTQKLFEIVSDQTGRPTFTRDIARFFLQLLRQPDCIKKLDRQFFHLGNEGSVSWADFAKYLFEKTDSSAQVKPIPSSQLNRPAKRPQNSVLSLNKVKKVFNLPLRTWQEAAEDFLREYQMSKK